jgi:protein phosphatase
VITKAIGIGTSIEADTMRLTLDSDESLLLCCDGVIAHLPDDDIHKIIRDSPDPQTACKEIVDMANERGGSDNISLIILSSEGSDIKEPEPPEPDDASTKIIN